MTEPFDLKNWLPGIINFAGEVYQTGATGQFKMSTSDRIPLNGDKVPFPELDRKWKEAIDFLRKFYAEVGAGFEFKLLMEIPIGWENQDGKPRVNFGLEVLNPAEILRRIEWKKHLMDTTPPLLYSPDEAKLMRPAFTEANRIQVGIFEDSLDFCGDNTGGNFSYFPGSSDLQKGIYAVDWDKAYFVSGTFHEFLQRLEQNCYLYPIPAIRWDSDWGPNFRVRLRNQAMG
jgi:hypothetical protein